MTTPSPQPASRGGTVARTEILLVVGLVTFIAAAWAIERLLDLERPLDLAAWGPLPAIVLSVVPAFLWLSYFYLQDRHEPEPKMFVFGVYVLGAFVAVPLSWFFDHAIPMSAGPAWAGGRLSPARMLIEIVPIGLSQELAKYLVVRYSIYLHDEFDEPMDGIIYMTAAGIGFATAKNFAYLESAHQIYLGTGTMNCVVTTLAHGCIAGVLGYALGVARFTLDARRRFVFLTGGLLVAATLNGAFDLLEAQVAASGMRAEPWRGVAFAAVFAGCVFAATFLLMRRHLAISPMAPGARPAEGEHV